MTSPALHPKHLLAPRGLRPKSSFGQNFLADERQLDSIARCILNLRADSNDPIIELGAGAGALTKVLLDSGATLHAVERDRDMVPILRERFADELNAERFFVHEANAVTFPYEPLAGGKGILCGNLPYHLTSSLVLRAIDGIDALNGVVFLVQLEVAERLAASPGNKSWGVLSVLLQYVFDVELALRVPKGAFWPVPEVDGGVVRMVPRQAPLGGEVSMEALKTVVKTAFGQRRKTLRNTLSKLGGAALLEQAGVDPGLRAERLDVETFVRLAQIWSASQTHPLPTEASPGTDDA